MMTLKELLLSRGLIGSLSEKKTYCPFHKDDKPSAYVNPNNLYCFGCARVYYLNELEDYFKIKIDKAQEEEIEEPESDSFDFLFIIPESMKG